jgi:hypothetical protein
VALELLLGMGLFSHFLSDLNIEVLLDDDEDDNPDPGGYGICDGNATKLKIAAKTCSSTGIWSGVRVKYRVIMILCQVFLPVFLYYFSRSAQRA